MLSAENANGNQAYTVNDLLSDLKQTVFTELATKKPIDAYRRNLQKAYIERLGAILNPAPVSGPPAFVFGNAVPQMDVKKGDIISYLKGHAKEMKVLVDAAAAGTTDKTSKYHLQDISDRLKLMLNPKA
jgi:hypothetical protein